MSLDLLMLEEECGRVRCGYIYTLIIKDREGIERRYFIDLNHEAELVDGKPKFKRNGRWDYNKHPLDIVVISIESHKRGNNYYDQIIQIFNSAYRRQEQAWKENFNQVCPRDRQDKGNCYLCRDDCFYEN